MRTIETATALMLLMAGTAYAATPQLEGADISGNGGTLTISRLPIKTANGIIYRDVTIQLRADENGNVSFARGRSPRPTPGSPANTPMADTGKGAPEPVTSAAGSGEAGLTEAQPLVQTPSRPPKIQQFKTGTYEASDHSLVHVSGGGNAVLEGVPFWRLSSLSGGPITSATWYEGLISDNPRQRMIRRAGITSLDYAYGTSETGDGMFTSGALLGATQTGNTLTIVSFHHGCCSAVRDPVASVTYTFIGR